jgi:hypothetical protein
MHEQFLRRINSYFLLNRDFLNLPSMGTELSGLLANTISTYSSCKRSRLDLKPSIICLRERPFSVSALENKTHI